MQTHHSLIETIHDFTERYTARYGSVLIGVYKLQGVNGGEFSRYLNSLKITLDRQALMVSYCWQYQSPRSYILFLFICQGYGRCDLSDLFPIIQRLWMSHSMIPVEQLDELCIGENSWEAKGRLERLALASTESRSTDDTVPHRRTNGSSRML